MHEYANDLAGRIPEKDSLKLVKAEAALYLKAHTPEECFAAATALYQSTNFQIQEVGVLLLGGIACEIPEALPFLRDTVSLHESWKVQEVLAMAFDSHCRRRGYEAALPLIREWLGADCANVRRAVTEGLRVWTSRPYFNEHPEAAIQLLAAHKDDASAYVRKSAGNALRDISKKHAALVAAELSAWDRTDRRVDQTYKLASRFLLSRAAE